MLNSSFRAYLVFLGLFALCIGGLTQCQEKSTNQSGKPDAKKQSPKTDNGPKDKKIGDMAKFLAGINGGQQSNWIAFESNAEWAKYAEIANTQWAKIGEEKLKVMQNWRDSALQEVNQAGGLLFYPFSGPDVLHAVTFFPNADTIVMMGLEPIGKMPDLEKISKAGMGAYFNALQKALESILGQSFFQTVQMQTEFTGKVNAEIDGTLPVLLLFLARTNCEVLYYERVALTEDGKLVLATESAEKNKKDKTYYATKIDFRQGAEGKRQILYYFGVNLSDTAPYVGLGSLQERTDLSKYLKQLNITTTYLKSASYQLHRPYFNVVRSLIVERSRFIMQDDSGLPFAKLTEGGHFDLTLFGRYAGPIPLFSAHVQKDMDDAYRKRTYPVKDLPFGIGYQYKKGDSNLVLAKRKSKKS